MATPEKMTPSVARQFVEAGSLRFNEEHFLTVTIIFFAVVSLAVLVWLSRGQNAASPFLLRIYIVTIIIFGTLLVVSSSYSTEQIGPVLGLFGTIAGYILGRSDKPSADRT